MTTQLVGRRYQILNEIGGGGMGTVYRALDRLTNTVVALKRVSISGKLLDSIDVGSDFRLALAQEFRVLSSLHHPNIISVLDYGFDAQRRPYFTMELLEDASNIVQITKNESIAFQINMVVQLLQALAYLHRRGIIHRDLKPDNVMVIGKQVKVLDFGLAAVHNRSHDEMQETENLVGTLAFMAPEVLAGLGATELSDLYAVGLIAYEIIAREGPFTNSDFGTLLTDIARRIPDIEALDVNENIQAIIARLLSKEPHSRYEDAQSTITALDTATPFQLEFENSALRESFLQAATFVGREKELALLIAALEDARHDSKGSSWLLGGESGVGKSRLMDELRTQALVTGALVLRGQAIIEGGAPYFEWLPVLRLLILQTELSDFEAGVLKEIIPDIHTLMGRDSVDDAPDIDAASAQSRLLNVIQGLFKRQTNPIVVLLEDLHWANESLEVLRRLNEIVETQPLLIVGNYRTEERGNLPDELPGMKALELERLSRSEITELSESIIGQGGQRPEVVDLLTRETEGNVFFIVEVMRVLADEAGELSRIGEMTLPASVFADGIKTVIERRLQHLPLDTIPLLRLAAIAGKDIDLALMEHLNTGVNFDQWLTQCVDTNVLEVLNNEWRFTHDKLRDGLIMALSSSEQAEIHSQVAEGIEAVYGEDSLHLVNLAYHWEKAATEAERVDTRTLDKAIYYLEKSAEQAVENNIHDEGLVYMEQLFELDKKRQLRLGHVATKDQRAHWHFLLSQVENALRRFDSTRNHFEKAAQLYGYPLPKSNFALGMGIFSQIIGQTMRRLLPALFARRAPQQQHEKLLAAARVVRFAGAVYYVLHEQIRSLYTTLRAVNITEKVGESPELMEAYGLMCILAGNFQLQNMAQSYYEQAIDMAEVVKNPVSYASTLFLTSLYHTGAGMHDVAERDLVKSAEISLEVGHVIQWGYAMITLGTTYINHGRFDDAADVLQLVVDGQQTRLAEHRAMALSLLARLDMVRGKVDDAVTKSSEALVALQEIENEPQIALTPWSYSALIYLRHNAYQAAYEAAEMTMKLATEARANANLGFAAFGNIAEVYLTLSELEDNQRPDTRENLLQKAKKVVNILRVGAPPIGKPVLMRVQAWLMILEGNTTKANKSLQKGLEIAESVNMPYEIARIQYEWGRHLPESDTGRDSHLQSALEIFEQIDATHDAQQSRILLGGKVGEVVAK